MTELLEFHGLPAVRWQSRDGACAIATLQGAQLVSWTLPGGGECLYLSDRSPFEPGRPIRGGIPVCFPQFADRGPLAQHGFARNLAWRVEGVGESEEGARATFMLDASPGTMALWPAAFRVELAATIAGARLDVRLRVLNRQDQPFTFAAALHTYLRVSEAARAQLEGLRGTRYLNRGEAMVNVEDREVVTAREPVDRIYFAAPAATRLSDAARVLRIEQRGFADTVVWNPGHERTSQMADMPPDGYRHMLCVEAASIEPPVTLAAGAEWSGAQTIAVLS